MKTADLKTEKEILNAIRRQLPVGYIPNHTNEALPEMVAYHVKRSALLGKFEEDARNLLDEEADVKSFIRFAEELTLLEIL